MKKSITPLITITPQQRNVIQARLLSVIRTQNDLSWVGNKPIELADDIEEAAKLALKKFFDVFEVLP